MNRFELRRALGLAPKNKDFLKLQEIEDGLVEISAKSLEKSEDCAEGGQAHFIINQVREGVKKPQGIHVEGLTKNGEVWRTDFALNSNENAESVAGYTGWILGKITKATTKIDKDWSGEFNLSDARCVVVPKVTPTSKITETGIATSTYTLPVPSLTPTVTPDKTMTLITPVVSGTPSPIPENSPTITPTGTLTQEVVVVLAESTRGPGGAYDKDESNIPGWITGGALLIGVLGLGLLKRISRMQNQEKRIGEK